MYLNYDGGTKWFILKLSKACKTTLKVYFEACERYSIWTLLVRILQGNRRLIDWLELAHMFWEADKSQDLQGKLTRWGPKRADGLVPVCVWRPENQNSQWCSSRLKAGRLEALEMLMFQFEFKGRKKIDVPFQRLLGRNSFSPGGWSAF